MPGAFPERIVPSYQRGFSLMEMFVVLLISSLVLLMAAPQFYGLVEVTTKHDTVKRFEFDLKRTRNESLSAGVRSVVNLDLDGQGYTVGLDLLPYGESPSIDQEIFSESLADSVTLSITNQIIFDSRGFLVDEFGQPTTSAATFSINSEDFCTASISSTGEIDFDCLN